MLIRGVDPLNKPIFKEIVSTQEQIKHKSHIDVAPIGKTNTNSMSRYTKENYL